MDLFTLHKVAGKISRVFDQTTKKVLGRPSSSPTFVLYQMEISPYCKLVTRFLAEKQLGMEIKDILESDEAYREMMVGGKRDMVPCLRIRAHASSSPNEDRWMYESNDIVQFLKNEFNV